jgi:hypothetical protein
LLKLTHLAGFAAGAADVKPNAIDFTDISAIGETASAMTNTVTITGIDVPIALRLTLSSAMSVFNIVDVFRNGVAVGQGTSGTTIDVTVTNGQTLEYAFTNAADATTWSGTATLSNLTDANTVLDTFTYALQDIGGGGGEGPPP